MKLTYSDYTELPAPISVCIAALRDPATWATLPTGAERLGTFWQARGDLYSINFHDTLSVVGDYTHGVYKALWEVLPLGGGIAPRLAIEVALSDSVITTHAELTIDMILPGGSLPWQRYAMRKHIQQTVRTGILGLQALLRDQALDPPDQAHVFAPLEERLTVSEGGERPETPPVLAFPATSFRNHTPQAHQHALAERLAAHYPQTVEQFRTMGALESLERVYRLEQGWQRIMQGEYDKDCYTLEAGRDSAPLRYDLIYAGSGLGLLHAVIMAYRYGQRVLIFDRGEVGCAHREWNISRPELQVLVELGVLTWADLEPIIMREYRDGLVRFYTDEMRSYPDVDLWLPEVLNVAIDARGLQRLLRRKIEAAGGTILSQRTFRRVRVAATGPIQVTVELEALDLGGAIETYRGRLLLDGMGSTSPLGLYRHAGQPFAGVCPTVGTVARGFVEGDGPRELDLDLGDILVSIADAQAGQQMMWEGFPGRHDELTVYLFYYATLNGTRTSKLIQPPTYSLLELFEQYFALLPTYKRPGPDFEHLRPVYGYIPSRHSLSRSEAPLLRGVLPVGDSAAQQSPLTFCGFGSHVRNIGRTTGLLAYALEHDLLAPTNLRNINAFQSNVSLNWIFSRFMHPWERPDDVNSLQNAFTRVLQTLGTERATRFFQDRMQWGDYLPMLATMMYYYPSILSAAYKVLGIQGIGRWMNDYMRFSTVAFTAYTARMAGPASEQLLYRISERFSPALSLQIRAHYAEWKVMRWY